MGGTLAPTVNGESGHFDVARVPMAQVWDKYFATLKAWKAQHEGADPPFRAKFQGMNLGSWCGKQRRARKTRKLLASREERLQGIGFTWGGLSSEELWDRNFVALKAWKAQHGGDDPPKKATFRGLNLGLWCDRQRQARKKNKLLTSRVERLQGIGFTWGSVRPSYEESWDRNFAALKAWKAQHGGDDPPYKATFQGLNLGIWCQTQRQARKKHKLLASRVERLQGIGFTWNPGRGVKRKRCHREDEDQRVDGSESCQEEDAWREENVDGFILKTCRAV